jgi:anaphase-promoting complex subunit 1
LFIDSDNLLVPFTVADLAEPPSDYCILTWIQGHLATSRGTEYPTLSDLFANVTRDVLGGRLRGRLWASLTPRTLMFEKLFARLGVMTHRSEAVVAMHECGFSPQVLETLPEAVLTPLQDMISICQPNPPPSWSKELLALVSRTDMSGVLQPTKTWRVVGSDIKVSARRICLKPILIFA